ncbi:MAG: CHAD domain-containing protein [Alcaligenaceae bacterium]|nr:CHAD domain-containing protein [Alcaligenaceae bacterium]
MNTTSDMLEREIKFHVPPRRRAGLKARLRKLNADSIDLHARYYDTATQRLAQAGIALRLRREGDNWIQTIKLPGPDELSRIEWNHPRPEAVLDLSVYDGTHIEGLMAELGNRLICRYITHVTRLKKEVPTASGIAELAYDEGAILAGGLALPIHELELEGVSGEAADLFKLSREWLHDHELILELRSKAARGDALASLEVGSLGDTQATALKLASQGGKPARLPALAAEHVLRLAAPARAGQLTLAPDASLGAAYLECANDCASQIIRNSSFLAGVDGMKTSHEQRIEYVHQIRVGIRRLRTCWQLFGKAAECPDDLLENLKHHFQIFGQARDLDVIQTELLPRLIHAGMPPNTAPDTLEISDTSSARAGLTAAPEYQQVLLDLLEHLVLYGDKLPNDRALNKRAAPQLCKRLNIWLSDIKSKASAFLEADWDERHMMRKRVKRLRYGMEFSQGALDPARLTPLRNALMSAQKALGQLNDLYVAAEYYRGAGARHTSAMFALGWLAATQGHEAQASQMALQRLSKSGRFSPAAVKTRKQKRG